MLLLDRLSIQSKLILMLLAVSLGSIFLIMDRVALNALVKLPLMLVWLPLGALFVQRWGAEGAAAYQLGAYLTGDLIYFGILLTPWFWRSHHGTQVAPQSLAQSVVVK